MIPPKVFISYSHDSAEHKQWVLDFATTLRNRGVDAILDQWDLKPGDDLPHFMEQNLESSDFAVMVCTQRYVAKANAGTGGVGYEKMIMTSASLTKISDNKVIPIVREGGEQNVPTFLRSKMFIDFTRDEEIEYALDELLRVLLEAPLFIKPEIGSNPFKPLSNSRPDRSADGIKEIMTEVITFMNTKKSRYLSVGEFVRWSKMHFLKSDKYLKEALTQGLIDKASQSSYFEITSKGINYAEQHGLIEL